MEPARPGFYERIYQHFLFRYAVSGGTGAAIQMLVLYIWVSVLGFRQAYAWGAVIGFTLSVVASFVLQKYWTFRERSHQTMHLQLFLYFCLAVTGLLLNVFLLHVSKLLIEYFGFNFFHYWYLGAQVVVILLLALFSFSVSYFIIFKKHD